MTSVNGEQLTPRAHSTGAASTPTQRDNLRPFTRDRFQFGGVNWTYNDNERVVDSGNEDVASATRRDKLFPLHSDISESSLHRRDTSKPNKLTYKTSNSLKRPSDQFNNKSGLS